MLEIQTKAIVKFMHKAKLHIQYPKVHLRCLDNLSMDMTIQLSVAGNKAKYPDSINITDGKPYGHSKFYGRILTDGQLRLRIESSIIENELELFAKNPTEYAKLYSNATGNCMFCSRDLTDPQSVAVGYGPICAGHYDLPHGKIEQKVANDMAQIEMEMPTTIAEPTIQHSIINENGLLPFYDITKPNHGMQVEIRADQTVVWISIDGQTVLRVCQIAKLTIENRGK